MSAQEIARFDPIRPFLGLPLVDPDDSDASSIDSAMGRRKPRSANRYFYKIGKYETSTFYCEFLSDDLIRSTSGRTVTVRETTEHTSLNPKSTFRAWFRMPLSKVAKIVDCFINEGWICLTHHCQTMERLQLKAELLILGTLCMIAGTIQSFRQLKPLTHICATEHSNFFLQFVERVASISGEYIFMPRTPKDLGPIMRQYEEAGLPGVAGSVDVVHVKWANCPAGDYNRSKGKESYPSLAFECITDYDRRILGVCGPQFGSNNDKHIVKIDKNIHFVNVGWLSQVKWKYYSKDGSVSTSTGAYVICDNGYICWLTTICPFMSAQTNSPLEDYFSTTLESLRKDVECVFGILKARWASLDKGFKYRKMKTCGEIFLTCAVLHNMMLSEMVREEKPPRLQRVVHLVNDGIWLEGPSEMLPVPGTDHANKLKEAFDQRRIQLCHHLRIWKERNKNT
jgi:hypothetical protein